MDSILCPICKRIVKPDDPEMPFCSERCRIIDLANWATEKYVIPAAPESEELDEPDEWLHRRSEGSE